MPVYIMRAAADIGGGASADVEDVRAAGAINPHRTPKGQRQYSDNDIETVREIRKLTREAG